MKPISMINKESTWLSQQIYIYVHMQLFTCWLWSINIHILIYHTPSVNIFLYVYNVYGCGHQWNFIPNLCSTLLRSFSSLGRPPADHRSYTNITMCRCTYHTSSGNPHFNNSSSAKHLIHHVSADKHINTILAVSHLTLILVLAHVHHHWRWHNCIIDIYSH